MKDIIPGDYSRCIGELAGDDWGHADKVCEAREHCKRYIQRILDCGKKDIKSATITGWACATVDKEMRIPMEEQGDMISDQA